MENVILYIMSFGLSEAGACAWLLTLWMYVAYESFDYVRVTIRRLEALKDDDEDR